jgi:hypothetical protein
MIVWFGPRGLSSLLLVLLPVFAGLPDAERLFAPAAIVVLLSVLIHGGSLALLGKGDDGRGKRVAPAAPSAPPELGPKSERITLDEVRRLQAAGERVRLLDVRRERAYRESDVKAKGAIRLSPEGNVARAAAELALPRNDWLVAYCA